MEARKVIASEAPPQFSSFSHLGILLERADGAEALLAQAKGWSEEHWRPKKCLETSDRRSDETIAMGFCDARQREKKTVARLSLSLSILLHSLLLSLSLPSVL